MFKVLIITFFIVFSCTQDYRKLLKIENILISIVDTSLFSIVEIKHIKTELNDDCEMSFFRITLESTFDVVSFEGDEPYMENNSLKASDLPDLANKMAEKGKEGYGEALMNLYDEYSILRKRGSRFSESWIYTSCDQYNQ